MSTTPPLSGLHVVVVPSWWPSPEQPTAGIFFLDYVRAFAAAGAKVGVIYPDLVSLRLLRRGTPVPLRPRLLRESVGDVPVYRIRGRHTALGMPRLHMPRFCRWLKWGLSEYVRDHGAPDVLHAMCAIPAGWSCARLAKMNPAPRVVVTEHTGPFRAALSPPSAGRFASRALADADAVVAVSEGLRREMISAGVTRDIHVIRNPVGAEFTSAPPPIRHGPDGRAIFRGLFVGRLTREKGINELILAAEKLSRAGGPRIEWHFAGSGPLEQDIRSLLASEPSDRRAVLHGVCERSKVASLIRDSHFIVLPSHGENCPLAVCEAQMCGRPVIGTRQTGCAELIDEGDGLLFDVGDAEGLAQAVQALTEDYGRWNWEEISRRAARRFSGAVITRRYSAPFCP